MGNVEPSLTSLPACVTSRGVRLYLSLISCALPCAVADVIVGRDAVRSEQFVTGIES